MNHRIDCTVEDREPDYGAEAGVHAVRCTLVVIRSVELGRSVSVDEIEAEFRVY